MVRGVGGGGGEEVITRRTKVNFCQTTAHSGTLTWQVKDQTPRCQFHLGVHFVPVQSTCRLRLVQIGLLCSLRTIWISDAAVSYPYISFLLRPAVAAVLRCARVGPCLCLVRDFVSLLLISIIVQCYCCSSFMMHYLPYLLADRVS